MATRCSASRIVAKTSPSAARYSQLPARFVIFAPASHERARRRSRRGLKHACDGRPLIHRLEPPTRGAPRARRCFRPSSPRAPSLESHEPRTRSSFGAAPSPVQQRCGSPDLHGVQSPRCTVARRAGGAAAISAPTSTGSSSAPPWRAHCLPRERAPPGCGPGAGSGCTGPGGRWGQSDCARRAGRLLAHRPPGPPPLAAPERHGPQPGGALAGNAVGSVSGQYGTGIPVGQKLNRRVERAVVRDFLGGSLVVLRARVFDAPSRGHCCTRVQCRLQLCGVGQGSGRW